MYIRNKFQRLKEAIKSIASPDINVTPYTFDRFGGWPQLHVLHQLIEDNGKHKDVFIRSRWTGEFIRCLGIFESQARLKKHQEYKILQEKFESLFEDLQPFYSQVLPPEWTSAMQGLYLSIEHELLYLQEWRSRDRVGAYSTVEQGEDVVMACYSLIYQRCAKIILSLLTWQIAIMDGVIDTIDDTFNLMSHLLEHVSVDHLSHYELGHKDSFKLRPCASGTRTGVLSGINDWIKDPSSGSMYWINGMAGTGKTTIAYSLCKQLNEQHKLAASHFCSRSPWYQDSRLIIPSIAYQLARFSWPFRSALSSSKLLSLQDPGWLHDSHSPDLLFMSLISQPLLEIESTLPGLLVVVIDGIDMCTDKEFSRQLLEVLLARTSSLPLKIVISSRPEPQVRGPMNNRNERVVLHELDKFTVRADIETYFRSSLLLNTSWQRMGGEVVRVADDIPALARQSGGLFMWAATLHQEISARGISQVPLYTGALYPETIRSMYTHILQAALDEPSLDERDSEDMRRVLYLTARNKKPLEIHRISKLLKFDHTDRVWALLQPLWSVLHVSEDRGTVKILHSSFRKYILDPLHSGQYCCDPSVYGHRIALRCFQYFQLMQPWFNICRLESSYMPDSKVAKLDELVQALMPINLFHAARHWAVHLGHVPVSPDLLRGLEQFLSLHLLLWMEVMTLKGHAHEIPEAIRLVKGWGEQDSACSEDLRALMHDAWRFTMTFSRGVVSTSTPHIYISMLLFWPNRSTIAKHYAGRMQKVIQAEGTALDRQQDTLLATWHFTDVTRSPVVSPDGAQIAIGVGNDVLVLSALTGRLALRPLKGHKDGVLNVRFSPDGTRIVSSSIDCTIRVWRIRDGVTIVGPIHGHAGIVNSVAFSLDGMYITSGSQDGTLFIWDALTGARTLGPLTGYDAISEVLYAPDGRWVVTCTRNGVVARSSKDGRVLQVFLPQSNDAPLCSMDISPDSSYIACGSIKHIIYIWDIESGQLILGPLSPAGPAYDLEPFVSVSFSPDGSHLVSSSLGRDLYLWDTQTGDSIHGPLEGHTGGITGVNFSPDGTYIVSGSHDKTIRLWSVQNTLPTLKPVPGHANPITSVGFSPDGARIVSGSIDRTVCVWDCQDGDILFSPLAGGHKSRARNAYSPMGSHILSDTPGGLVLLDSRTGHIAVGPIQVVHTIQSALLSTDGTCIILGSTRNIVQVLSANTGETVLEFFPPFTNQSKWVHMTSITSSPDSSRIAVGSRHYSFSIHDAHNGKLLYGPFDGHTNDSSALAFSPDGTRIASGSFSRVQVQDAQSGEIVLGPLNGHTGWVTSVDYSPNGAYIVSGARDNSICVWDAQTGEPVLGPVKWHTGPVRCVKFSPDGTRVVSGSDDKTIRVTNIRRDLDFLSNSSTPTGTDWGLNEDGWVKDEEERLLVWVPPELRTVLMWPRTELLISTRGWLRLNFANACIGESWMECYKPPLDVPTGQTPGLDVLDQTATTSPTTMASPISVMSDTSTICARNVTDDEEPR
ncbi:unnamed protein product [Rhizoctonia solani]|uniref:Nephrocystin 3-like N-terminal domain-containing protein n=1 Tax=Rhizoctonia solani TaxID=456999 RepID=A0A8H2WEM0_9AGAM|nr:unnamed protein product [Rhizoctonia solani]CAE6376171.1 unnamed protein product [Rhizoctonia solani]